MIESGAKSGFEEAKRMESLLFQGGRVGWIRRPQR